MVQVYIKLEISSFQVYVKLQISNFEFSSNLKFRPQTRNFTVQTRNFGVQTRNFAFKLEISRSKLEIYKCKLEISVFKLENWMSTSSMYWFKINNPGLILGDKFQVLRVNFKFGDTSDIPNFKFELNSNFQISSLFQTRNPKFEVWCKLEPNSKFRISVLCKTRHFFKSKLLGVWTTTSF